MLLTELLYLLLGWLLGLLSPLVVDGARKRRQTPALYRALMRELQDLRYRLVMSVYLIQQSRGRLTPEILHWAIPLVEKYDGSYRSNAMVSRLRKLVSGPEDELNPTAGQRAADGVDNRLDVLEAPFLERLVPELDRFSPQVQRILLDIRTQLGFFNRLPEDQRAMLALTWSSSLTESNRRRVERNIQMTYDNVVERARLIVQRIGCLEEKRI